MAGQGTGGRGWWCAGTQGDTHRWGEHYRGKAPGARESDGSRGPTEALSRPEEGGYLFRWSRRKRKVSRLASGSDSSRFSMQLSFATGSESAAGGGGWLLLTVTTPGWKAPPGPGPVTILPSTLAPGEGPGVGAWPPWTPYLTLRGVGAPHGPAAGVPGTAALLAPSALPTCSGEAEATDPHHTSLCTWVAVGGGRSSAERPWRGLGAEAAAALSASAPHPPGGPRVRVYSEALTDGPGSGATEEDSSLRTPHWQLQSTAAAPHLGDLEGRAQWSARGRPPRTARFLVPSHSQSLC